MPDKPLLKLFEENEINISILYDLYGRKIPKKKVFWDTLSKEEVSHAMSIKKQIDDVEEVIENKFSRGVVKYIMDFVTEEIKKAQKKSIGHEEALRTALRVEQSMLERKCFDIFTPTDEAVKKIFLKLGRETEAHIKKLTEEMKKNKFTF